MHINYLIEKFAKIDNESDRHKYLMELCSSSEHIWGIDRKHFDWDISTCIKCGCMKIFIVKGDPPNMHYITKYKSRGALRWNPFQKLQDNEPPCIASPKSVLHPARVHLLKGNLSNITKIK